MELEEHSPRVYQSFTKVVPIPTKPFADSESMERRGPEREIRTQWRDVRRPSVQEEREAAQVTQHVGELAVYAAGHA